jgi:hypothetical protein
MGRAYSLQICFGFSVFAAFSEYVAAGGQRMAEQVSMGTQQDIN